MVGRKLTFHSNTPVAFGQDLINSLQRSPEVSEVAVQRCGVFTTIITNIWLELQTDSTRAKNLELQIQSRVTAELEKLLASSTEKLESVSNAISEEPLPPRQPRSQQPQSSTTSWTEKPLLNRISDTLTGGSTNTHEDKAFQDQSNLDRDAVAKEIEQLRKRLEGKRKVTVMDRQVARAKEQVVACLRLNDRRPLDCWKEVENFKSEVGRLERGFIERNGT